MTDPTECKTLEELVPAEWWTKLKAAPADDVEKAKELCTSGKLKELAYDSLDVFITILEIGGPLLPPPGNVAASLLSGLCKCVQGVHLNNTNLKNLRDRCLDILNLFLHVGGIGAFISTCRSSSKLPKLSKEFTSIMDRFVACIKNVIAYCEKYTKEGFLAGSSRFFFYFKHMEDFKTLATDLRDLTALAGLALGVVNTRMLKDVENKLNTGLPPMGEAKMVELQARLREDIAFVPDEKLEEDLDGLKVSGYSILLHQPHLRALWSKHFMHEQAVRWGLWWTVFPGELALDRTLDEAAREKLVYWLGDQDMKELFQQAVEVKDSNFISIDELCRSFPDDSPLLPTVEALLCKALDLEPDDKFRRELAMAEAGRAQQLALVQANIQSKISDLVATVKKDLALYQGRRRI